MSVSEKGSLITNGYFFDSPSTIAAINTLKTYTLTFMATIVWIIGLVKWGVLNHKVVTLKLIFSIIDH